MPSARLATGKVLFTSNVGAVFVWLRTPLMKSEQFARLMFELVMYVKLTAVLAVNVLLAGESSRMVGTLNAPTVMFLVLVVITFE